VELTSCRQVHSAVPNISGSLPVKGLACSLTSLIPFLGYTLTMVDILKIDILRNSNLFCFFGGGAQKKSGKVAVN
jgi:hypothetical protein